MVSAVHLNDLRNDIACDSGKLLPCPLSFYALFINLVQLLRRFSLISVLSVVV